jgi:heme exporter protein A
MRLSGKGLKCIRGGRQVFADLDFAVASGEALIVTGRNGAGKSSLLRLIAGLIPHADGTLTLEGGDPELRLAEEAHYLGHRDALKPALSVSENLAFWREFLGGAADGAEAALRAVGLDHIAHLPAAYLSAGQRRRLSIARLLTVRRPVWLLDEPTSALDTAAQAALGALMARHLSGGGIIVAATHGPLGLEGARGLHIGPAAEPAREAAP